MATRPPISVQRPQRHAPLQDAPPSPIAHSPLPAVNPDNPDALAYTLRGRQTQPSAAGEGEGTPNSDLAGRVAPQAPPASYPTGAEGLATPGGVLTSEPQSAGGAWSPDQLPSSEVTLLSVKLPREVGRRLGAIADRRGSKRTMVAIEVIAEPLRAVAAAHRAGRFPELPKVVSGTARASIAFSLPPPLAADLEFVVKQRRAVRAQVITRLLVPAINALYAWEVVATGR